MPDQVEEPRDVSVSELLGDTTPAQETTSPNTSQDSTNVQGQAEQGGESTEVGQQENAPLLKDRLAELGFTDVADDREATERLFEAYKLQQERTQQYEQQMQMIRMQMLAQQAQQQQPQQMQTEAQKAQQKYWNPPNVNREAMQVYFDGRNEDGSVKWRAGTPAQIMADYEAHQAYITDHSNRLVNDFGSIEAQLEQRVLDAANRMIEERLTQHQQRAQQESFTQSWIQSHEDVLYQRDPVTKQVRMDHTGTPMLSEAGVRLDSILSDLERSGMSDETARLRYAEQIYKAQYGDFRQQAADKIAQARAGHLAKTQAAHIPQRNGQEASKVREQGLSMGRRMFASTELAGLNF